MPDWSRFCPFRCPPHLLSRTFAFVVRFTSLTTMCPTKNPNSTFQMNLQELGTISKHVLRIENFIPKANLSCPTRTFFSRCGLLFVLFVLCSLFLPQHVVGHHIYTNVFGADPDLPETAEGDPRRLVHRQKYSSVYKYQHIYLPPLYGILGLKVTAWDIPSYRYQVFFIIRT